MNQSGQNLTFLDLAFTPDVRGPGLGDKLSVGDTNGVRKRRSVVVGCLQVVYLDRHMMAMFTRGKVTAHPRSGFGLFLTACVPRTLLASTTSFDDGFIPATKRA
jgi:hypothetical protein